MREIEVTSSVAISFLNESWLDEDRQGTIALDWQQAGEERCHRMELPLSTAILLRDSLSEPINRLLAGGAYLPSEEP